MKQSIFPIRYFLLFVLIALFTYFVFAFIGGDFNVMEWNYVGRFFIFFIALIITVIRYGIDKEWND